METTTIPENEINLLDPETAEFYATEGGFTGLRHGGADYPHITLKRSLPVGRPMDYVSVYDAENNEIAIIKHIWELSPEQRRIAEDELATRYYCPEITEIKSVKDKLGYVYIELLLKTRDGGSHTRSCAVKDVSRNIRMLGDKGLIIFDVEGNRYTVKELGKLDRKSLKRLDPFLY